MCPPKATTTTRTKPLSGALSAQLLLSKRVLPCCRPKTISAIWLHSRHASWWEPQRERESESGKPVWLPLQSACDCDWTKSTPYLKIIRSVSRSHSAGAAPLTHAASESVQRCLPERESEWRECSPKRAIPFAGSYIRRRIRWIQFEFWLRSVQTCSEKPESHSSDKR